jgi:hypothetical protein
MPSTRTGRRAWSLSRYQTRYRSHWISMDLGGCDRTHSSRFAHPVPKPGSRRSRPDQPGSRYPCRMRRLRRRLPTNAVPAPSPPTFMVGRGSTVRVRQRALQERRTSARLRLARLAGRQRAAGLTLSCLEAGELLVQARREKTASEETTSGLPRPGAPRRRDSRI